jgi:beta-alanine degradation protein BauB
MFLGHDNDALSASPEVHKLVFENEKIRILEINFPPKHKTLPHWHPKSLGYVINPTKMLMELPDGTRQEFDLKTGQTFEVEGVHTVENIGDTELKTIHIEFKE